MTDHEQEIRAALEAGPTPGEWRANGRYIGTKNHASLVGECRDVNGNWCDDVKSRADSRYIAACNPVATASLISELTYLREERDRLAKAEGHLNAVVDAWEALPGGRRIRVEEVEAWLVNEMAAIINVTRAYLGRPLPGARALIQETSHEA